MNARRLTPMPDPDHVVDEIGADGVTGWLEDVHFDGWVRGFATGLLTGLAAGTLVLVALAKGYWPW